MKWYRTTAGAVSILTIILFLFTSASTAVKPPVRKLPASTNTALYTKLNLQKLGLSEKAYQLAIRGWQKLKERGEVAKSIISICDFTQSANNKRLYVIDLSTGRLLFNTFVAHGRNTGEEFARSFSNQPSSCKSSLGFYTTKGTYNGEHGLSLKLEGRERGFNDHAADRAIVMHGADYVNDCFIQQYGRLGRSLGCPSIPADLVGPVINTIKDGTCLFIYYPDKTYLANSKLLR